MKLFDVMMVDPKFGTEVPYRTSLAKKNAKKMVEDLKNRGYKARFVTSKNRQTENVVLEQQEDEE
jgi:phosphoglycolate phosphatase-like HAD superfamily hydrolase